MEKKEKCINSSNDNLKKMFGPLFRFLGYEDVEIKDDGHSITFETKDKKKGEIKMASKIEIEIAKIENGLTYYNCTAYNYDKEVIGFVQNIIPAYVTMFVKAFTMGNDFFNEEI